MKIQQKLLAVLMVVVMLVSMVVPMTASAETEAAETSGIDIRIQPANDAKVGDIILIDVYITCEDMKSLMVTLDYDADVLEFLPDDYDTYWSANDRAIDRNIAMSTFKDNIPSMAFDTAMSLDDVALLHLAFEVISDTFDPGDSTLVSFKDVSYAVINTSTNQEESYSNEKNPELVTLASGTVHAYCAHENTEDVPAKDATCKENGHTAGVKCLNCKRAISGCETVPALGDAHNYAIDRYTGLMTCSACGGVCAHEAWTDSACDSCGLECTHDWTFSGTTATCMICGAKCASHAKKGLFLDCATCGYDMALANSYYQGNSSIEDTGFTLQTAHGFKLNTQLTVGSAETIFNIKDTARNDNVYYSAVENTTASDYFSLVTWVYSVDGVADTTFRSIVSLWLDSTDEFSSKVNGETPDNFVAPKLWLTAPNNSSQKICEIKAGETYDLTVYYDVKYAWSIVEVKQNGELIASYTADGGDFSGTLTSSKIRLGESANAKKIHIQKISFEDVIFSDTYEKGACRVCGSKCNHRYNVGGYCADCGVLGDPITYNDNTSLNGVSITGNSIGVFKSSNTSTVGIWQFFDETEVLLGHDYVMDMDVKFTEAINEPAAGHGATSRFIIWSDSNAAQDTTNTKFGVFIRTLADNDQVVLLGYKDGFKDTDPHMTFNLNEKHNLRIAVRSTPTATAGTYNNTAYVYLDGKLVYTQAFTLTAADGMAVRVGDHVARICRARAEIDSTFGIHFLDDTIEYIGAQEKENADYSADETFDIRFVFGFDDLYLEDVGVKVDASVSDGTTGTKVLSAEGKALTAIAANGVTKKVGVNGIGYGGYYMATAITGIELDTSKTYTFTLTPYLNRVEASDVTYMPYSYEITVSFDENDKMVIDYNKIG